MTEQITKQTEKPKTVTIYTAVETPAVKARINEVLGKRSPQFVAALIEIAKESSIAKCEPFSVIRAALTAATLDLPINKNLGFAFVVPYSDNKQGNIKVGQFQMGYKGFIQLAMRSGQYAAMNDFKVNREAFISYNQITEDLVVDPDKLDQSSDDIVGYGFYFRLVNGFQKTVFWSKERCQAHGKRYSQTYKKGFGLWNDNFHAQALKTVIKHGLSRYGILSVELQQAIVADQGVINEDGSIEYVDNNHKPEIKIAEPVFNEAFGGEE